MTYTTGGILDGAIVVWPELGTPEQTHIGHAIVAMPNHLGIALLQKDAEVFIPFYGLDALIEALKNPKEAHEFYEHLERRPIS